jgi:cytochrome P450 family 6
LCELIKRNYDKLKHNSAFGIFLFFKKVIVITEPEVVKEILVKNFENFHSHGFDMDEKIDPLITNVFFVKGQQWKDMRSKLSPIFTSGRMKMMFPIVASKADRMIEFLESQIGFEGSIEIKDVLMSYSAESIISVAFGIETNVHGNPKDPFKKAMLDITDPPLLQNIKNLLVLIMPKFAKMFNLALDSKDTIKFFTETVKNNLEYRQKNNFERNDFFQLIMNVMKTEGLSFNELIGNCFMFLFVG